MPITVSRLSSKTGMRLWPASAKAAIRASKPVVGGHGVDVAARHGDVAGGLLAEMEDVEQHLPLDVR